ncbi:MAG: anti-sigma factor [Herpetosiphon sp.]
MDDSQNPLCDELESILAAYALGSEPLPADADSHLASCLRCSQTLTAYQSIARLMPLSAPDAAPSSELRGRILHAAGAPVAAPAAPRSRRAFPPVWQRWLPRVVGMTLLVAMVVWNITLQSRLVAQQNQITISRSGWQTAIEVMNGPDVRPYLLQGSVASGHAWVSSERQAVCLVAQGLPPLSADRVYQTWIGEEGKMISAGFFVGQGSNAWTVIRMSGSLSAYHGITITAEPRGGSRQPSGPVVLRGSLLPTEASAPIDRASDQAIVYASFTP